MKSPSCGFQNPTSTTQMIIPSRKKGKEADRVEKKHSQNSVMQKALNGSYEELDKDVEPTLELKVIDLH
jgi:phage tail tube protein FII